MEAVDRLYGALDLVVNVTRVNHGDLGCSIRQVLPFDEGVQLLKQLKVLRKTRVSTF